jgi:hypothetical protein
MAKMRPTGSRERTTIEKLHSAKRTNLDYFFTPRTPSFAALATRNFSTVLAGILIFCCVLGFIPMLAFLFCFTSLPKPGKTNSPFFVDDGTERIKEYAGGLISLRRFGKCALKFCLGPLIVVMAADRPLIYTSRS